MLACFYWDFGTGEQKVFVIINKRGVQISFRRGGWEKTQKLTRGVDVYLGLKSNKKDKDYSIKNH